MSLRDFERDFDIPTVIGALVQVLRRNLRLFALLALVYALEHVVFVFATRDMLGDMRTNPLALLRSGRYWRFLLFAVPISTVVLTVLRAMLFGVAAADVTGGPTTLSAALQTVRQRGLMLFGVDLLVGWSIIGASLLLIVPGVLVALAFAVAGPALIIEKRGIIDSMQRSRALTRGHRLTIFLLLLILFACQITASIVIGIPTGILIALGGVNSLDLIPIQVITALLNGAILIVFTVGQGVVYSCLRRSKEGDWFSDLDRVFE